MIDKDLWVLDDGAYHTCGLIEHKGFLYSSTFGLCAMRWCRCEKGLRVRVKGSSLGSGCAPISRTYKP